MKFSMPALLIALGLQLGASLASATPLLALKESNNCAGCHKGGRGQRPFLWRRCTLDCQGCHIDPSGDGPRNQWGYYNSQASLPTFKFITPQDPLQDTSRLDLHYDGRIMQQYLNGETRTFPMNSEFAVRVRPFVQYLHLTYQNMLFGETDDELFRIVQEGDRRFRERYSVMVDSLPMNTYIKAYRGQPLYGVRRPNHTLWTRERTDLNQFATVDAVDVGATPNVPFLKFSHMNRDPYVPAKERQVGNSYHGGMRGVTLGWHVNTSGWNTKSEDAQIKMNAYGAGMNVMQFLFYGERNTRTVTLSDMLIASNEPVKIHPSSTISEYTAAYAGIPGVMFGTVQEMYSDNQTDSKRLNYFIDLHPIPFVQIEFWKRMESGARDFADSLGIVHLYADF